MKNLESLTQEELISLIDAQIQKKLKEKANLKESITNALLPKDTLFILPNGFLIGTPYDANNDITPYIILTDVILLNSLTSPIKRTNFPDSCFQLAINQIVAFTAIDRDSFLIQLESLQDS